jgi:hypothetical protein
VSWEQRWLAEQRRKRQPMVDTKRRRVLRNRLFRADPHCCNCGCELQTEDPEAPDAAGLVDDQLACQRCRLIVHRVNEFYAAGAWG